MGKGDPQFPILDVLPGAIVSLHAIEEINESLVGSALEGSYLLQGQRVRLASEKISARVRPKSIPIPNLKQFSKIWVALGETSR
jgi:hypothetical protein